MEVSVFAEEAKAKLFLLCRQLDEIAMSYRLAFVTKSIEEGYFKRHIELLRTHTHISLLLK